MKSSIASNCDSKSVSDKVLILSLPPYIHKTLDTPARLDRSQRPRGRYGFRQAVQAVTAEDEDVLDATVTEFSADAAPELSSFRSLNPDSQDVLDSIHVNTDGDVGALVLNDGAVLDFHDQRIKVNDGIEDLQRPGLPGQDFIENLVRDFADGLMTEFRADGTGQVMLDVSDGHATRIEADDHVIQPTKPSLAFGNQRRDERPVTVPRNVQGDAAGFGMNRLRTRSVTRVRVQLRFRIAFLVTQMTGHFSLQATFQNGFD